MLAAIYLSPFLIQILVTSWGQPSLDFSLSFFFTQVDVCAGLQLNFTGLGHKPPLSGSYFNQYVLHLLIFCFKVINQWIMDQAPLGNKTPRQGFSRQIWCPACRGLLDTPLALSSGHVLLECMAVEGSELMNLNLNMLQYYEDFDKSTQEIWTDDPARLKTKYDPYGFPAEYINMETVRGKYDLSKGDR